MDALLLSVDPNKFPFVEECFQNIFFRSLVDCWHALARDGTMFPQILQYILDLMAAAQEHSFDTPEGTNIKIVTDKSLYTVAGFVEVIKVCVPTVQL